MTNTPAKSKSLRKAPGLSTSRKVKKAGSDFSRTMAALQEIPINQVVPQITVRKENNTPMPFTPCKELEESTKIQHNDLLDSFVTENHCISQLP